MSTGNRAWFEGETARRCGAAGYNTIMEFGILGLSLSGKSTLFALLTGHLQAGHGKRAAQTGVAKVPDERLDRLTALFAPRKHTPATVQFVDVPALVRGGEDALNVPELRAMDALAVVLRAFEAPEIPHPEGMIEAGRDLELVATELLLADLTVVENRLERLAKDIVKRRSPELLAEQRVCERCLAALAEGRPVRELELSPEGMRILKGFGLLTAKPMLIIVNLGENHAARLQDEPEGLLPEWGDRHGCAVTAVCATLEEEISRLAPEDQVAFLADLGLPDRALDRLLRAAYRLTGRISFFTVGEDECRAWSVPEGTTASRAAGAIHSDLERGFIRAEVARWDELVEAGSLAALRGRGELRLEGRDYVVQDGDVVHIRSGI